MSAKTVIVCGEGGTWGDRYKFKLKYFIALIFLASHAMGGDFLFVTFRNDGGAMAEQIYFATSQDGQTWSSLNSGLPVLISNIGEKGVRDPYILRSHDGSKFFIIATDLSTYYNGDWTRAQEAGSQSILVWESTDLVNWSEPRLVAVAASDAGCTWAPEAVYDKETGDYLVFWASKNANDGYVKQRIWACRTSDFQTFSTPFIYIERPNHIIDTDIVEDNGTYYRFSKDETVKALTMETSERLMGPWTSVTNFSLGTMQGYEGPECYRLDTNTWCLITDHYAAGTGYAPFTTTDLASGSFTAAGGFTFPFPFRHGSVLPITTEEYNALQAKYGPRQVIIEHAQLLFNEASGTTAADATGNGWNATLVNGPLHIAGKGGNAVSLDGVDDYVSLPTDVVSSLQDFTISTWVNINTLGTWSRVFDFGNANPGSTTAQYMFVTPKSGGTGTVRFAITDSGYNNERVINGTAALPTGVWTHVAVTRAGSTGILYVNGVEVGRNADIGISYPIIGSTTQNWIGRSQFSLDPYFDGSIDDFRIYSGALSADEILVLYNGTAGALSSPWADSALGSPSLVGSAGSVDTNSVMSASGAGIQDAADEGHFAYRSWTGDGALSARLNILSTNATSTATAGIMFRNGLTSAAECLFLGLKPDGNLSWQYRATSGGQTTATNIVSTVALEWIRVTRVGDVFTAYASTNGVDWTAVGNPATLPLPTTLNLGLAVASGSNSALEVARFDNVLTTTFDDYQLWKASHGLAFDLADTAVPDGDNIPVLIKYALGMTPGSVAALPVSSKVDASFGINFTRPSPAPVNYVVQASSNLVTWTDIATLAYGGDIWTGPAVVGEGTGEPRNVTVSDISDMSSASNGFLRLLIQRPTP